MAKVLVITADMFEDSELMDTKKALEQGGHEVTVAAPTRNQIQGKRGGVVQPDITVDDVKVPLEFDYDMLLLPGGKAPAKLRDDEKVQRIARHFDEQGKLIAAICHGPQILLSAGILDGRTLTAYESVQKELLDAGIETRDTEVVVDRNLITSRNPNDIPSFNQAILERL